MEAAVAFAILRLLEAVLMERNEPMTEYFGLRRARALRAPELAADLKLSFTAAPP